MDGPTGRDLRDYQRRAIEESEAALPTDSVCLVAPTGSGKTVMGAALAARHHSQRVLVVTHRTELIDQWRSSLEALGLDVGILAGRRAENTEADCIVAGWQTLVSRSTVRPAADLLIVDECHHAQAEEWRSVLDAYPSAALLGLTATPQRKDGRPLGDIFTRLVVAAQYSELIKQGHLVPCRLYRPPEALGTDLAQEPLQAYEKYCPGRSCIVFSRTIEDAEQTAEAFNRAGHAAACISADTPALERQRIVEDFKDGSIRVLTNVFTLTEGFDHPATEAAILARGCGHTGTYLQMVGRVLRPAPGKTEAIIVDLPGISHVHGIPTEDRTYTLDGRPISTSAALRVCASCGYTWQPEGSSQCPSCGYTPPAVEAPRPRIYDMALVEVYAGQMTPDDAKTREWTRLRSLAEDRGWSLSFAAKEYEKLFHERPPLHNVTDDERRREHAKLQAVAAKKGYKPGSVSHRYKELFGAWPPR